MFLHQAVTMREQTVSGNSCRTFWAVRGRQVDSPFSGLKRKSMPEPCIVPLPCRSKGCTTPERGLPWPQL